MRRPPPNDQFSHPVSLKQTITFSGYRPGPFGKPPRMSARIFFFTLTLRSEEHTSELQSQSNLVCRLLLEKKNAVLTPCEKPNTFKFLTPNRTEIVQPIKAISTKLYGASIIHLQMHAQNDLLRLGRPRVHT